MSKAVSTTTTAASPLPSTSRRRLLAGSGFATALAAIGLTASPAPSSAASLAPTIPTDNPDSALFAACSRCVAAWDAIVAMPPGQEDEVWEALAAEWHDAVDAVSLIPARTRIGCKAKARVLILEMDDSGADDGDRERRLAWRLAHDILLGAMA